jgi:CelD/BcsL family acetyltransferase involved in cellulose biosynthesis
MPAADIPPENQGGALADMQTSIVLARSCGELAALRREWEALVAQAVEPNPLYEPWMLIPAVQSGVHGATFVCVFVRVNGVLAGVFPVYRVSRYKGMPLTVLRSWYHPSWMLGTPLVHRAWAVPCLEGFLGWVRAGGEGASAVEFNYLPCDGPFHGLLADQLRSHGHPIVFATESFTRALLRQAADADAYLGFSLSGDVRRNLRRRERRLREAANLSWAALRPGEDPRPWISDFLRLEAAGWKGKLGSALACQERNTRFVEAMLYAAHEQGRLQMIGLDVDGRPVARCCNILAGRGSFAYRTAYDESYARFSPGIALEVESIRQFHALPGVEWMDSLTDPDNAALNRLWMHRRMMQSLLVGAGAWGDLWVSMLPLLRWMSRRVRGALPVKTPEPDGRSKKQIGSHKHQPTGK